MAMPRKLKYMNLFNDGENYIGQIEEIELPELQRKMEEWRGGGMDGVIKTDQGMEPLSTKWKCGGLMEEPLRQFGNQKYDGVLLRATGSFQNDSTGATDSVELVMRGRHSTVGMGTWKQGDESPSEVTTELAYYKLTVNGEVLIEIDVLNMIFIVDGVDLMAEHRKNLGV